MKYNILIMNKLDFTVIAFLIKKNVNLYFIYKNDEVYIYSFNTTK